MTELVGHTLGQYHVTAQVGKGGMATVYKATQASMKRTVAIKVLPRSLTHEDKFLERFYREVEIVSSLQHPYILPVYDFGEYDGMPYIVMAYMSGGTLADLISEKPMPPNEVLRLVRQMADALDYAHRKGVIHRDFKPSNVLLDEQHNTYLTDFGLAKISESSAQLTGTGILGTPFYMAPEQAEPKALTPAADVYAMGVTVFQMLTGRVPYEAPTPLGVLMAHMTHPVPDVRSVRPDLSSETQEVIDRSMAKTVETRFPAAGALADALAYALKAATSELQQTEAKSSESTQALLMTNMLGQVIFVDQPCLRLLKRHHNEARNIIGKPLSDVLSIDRAYADQLIQRIGKNSRLDNERLEIKDAFGTSVSVMCSAVATRDDKAAFVGADITLRPIRDVVIADSDDFHTVDKRIATNDESYMQIYFVKQMQTLRTSLVQLGGKRLGSNLDRIINETSQRNVWPVTMSEGDVHIDLKSNDPDVYRALLSKAIAYAVNLVGKKMVMKGMQAVDKQLDPSILNLVGDLKLYELFDVL